MLYLYYGVILQNQTKINKLHKHHIITGRHPSPLSARYNKKGSDNSFFGHNYFSKCNEYLIKHNKIL